MSPRRQRSGFGSDSGQAAVEAALVLPLFMFVLLGALQLALMHQARLLTKYAAYKAVRVGAMTSVDHDRMERAALAVLLPTITGFDTAGGGNTQSKRLVHKTTSATEFLSSWPMVMTNRMLDMPALQHVELTVCSPTKELLGGGDEHDFDSETATGTTEGRQSGSVQTQGWKDFDRGRLAIQLTYNYRMIIPFADMMLYLIATGQENADLLWTFHLGKEHPQVMQLQKRAMKYNLAAAQGLYIMPIRSNYVMRMQSSLFPEASGHELPQKNECVLRFPKKGDGGGSATGNVEDGVDDDTDPEPPG